MNAMLEAIQDVVLTESEAEARPEPTQPDDTIETQLNAEITALWSDHVRQSGDRKATAKELRQIRAGLAERLAAMKTLLSRPGRLGQWRGRLKQQGIPRSTADRLVARHAETLGIENGNVSTEAIPEPTRRGAGAKLAEGLWPHLQKVVKADSSVVDFIARIAKISGINHQWRAKGLMIFNPVPKAASELSASASDPASQPSDDGNASSEERAAETATATPATEHVVGDGDDGAGAAA